MFTAKGRLLLNGQPFFAVGFNYYPSAAGCRIWDLWDPERIDSDLRQMADLGFNTARIFVFWCEFEPQPAHYDSEKIERLHSFVSMARNHGLYCIISLLTLWMNGEIFELPWRKGRGLWSNPEMLTRQQAFVTHVGSVLKSHHNVLAYDLGDEIMYADPDDARHADAQTVIEWRSRLANAIRDAHPGALVIQANEASSILGNNSFGPENKGSLDLLAIHGFPVWSPLHIEAVASYKASTYVPFLVAFSRAFGLSIVDELGTYGCDATVGADYLRATLCSAFVNGASGVAVWCWQDIASADKPYSRHPEERRVGLLDIVGNPKPAMVEYQAMATAITGPWAGLRPEAAKAAIYIPEVHRPKQSGYLGSPDSWAIAAYYSFVLFKRGHIAVEFARDDLRRFNFVVCPSIAHITLADQLQLLEYVKQGGRLLYSPGSYLHGFGGEELFGIRLTDFTVEASTQSRFAWAGTSYQVDWSVGQSSSTQIPIVAATQAQTLAFYENGAPALTSNSIGRGVAYYLNAPFEKQLNAPGRLSAASWHNLYIALGTVANATQRVVCDNPDVEVSIMTRAEDRYIFLINHAPRPTRTVIQIDLLGATQPICETVSLIAKGVHTLRLNA